MDSKVIQIWLWLLRIASGGTVIFRIIIWLDILLDTEGSLADSLWGIVIFNFFWQIPLLLVYGFTLAGLRYLIPIDLPPTDRYLFAGLLFVQAIDISPFIF
ncbi:MAG: hypothetical protein MUE95_05405 [Cyclobacteriaceae bacterium]|jgi:hypothetical protein|nr:hypothetical protein [Cyclobacteriaceae bacterium]